MRRQAAVNVDIDSLALYYRIHGLDERGASDVVWTRGVPRFLKLFEEVGIKATFFCVASDPENNPDAREQCEALVAQGHELASHSHTHPYNLTRLPKARIQEEVQRSKEILSDLKGSPVVGFRAPGYTMSAPVFEALEQAGYRYDTSLFPCPPYYLAKAAVLASMTLRGKRSESILDKPSIMWAKTQPHTLGAIHEYPVSVLPWLRAPFIGTSLIMMGERGYSLIRPWLGQSKFVNLEFHGIDMCDLERDGIDPVLLKQPDLRAPLLKKEALFRRVLTDLHAHWGVSTLEAIEAEGALA